MRYLIIIGDGMADLPLMDLGNRTPLEVARTDLMDKTATIGEMGVIEAESRKAEPESDIALLSLLGYGVEYCSIGRGAFEALGMGLRMEKGDIALRCNFATVNGDLRVIDERAGRVDDGLTELETAIQNLRLNGYQGKLRFKRGHGFKGALIIKDESYSTGIHAPMPRLNCKADLVKALDETPESVETAKMINVFIRRSYEILKNHPVNRRRKDERKLPANILIPWGVGTKPSLQPFHDKYGLKAACVAGSALVKGIGIQIGMSTPSVPGATGDVDTDVFGKSEVTLRMLRNHQLVLVHVGGADEASHDGDIYAKISIIEKIDQMAENIIRTISFEDTTVAILADHTTSTELRRHTSDPPPIVLVSKTLERKRTKRFSEKEALSGELGRIRGGNLIPLLLERSKTK